MGNYIRVFSSGGIEIISVDNNIKKHIVINPPKYVMMKGEIQKLEAGPPEINFESINATIISETEEDILWKAQTVSNLSRSPLLVPIGFDKLFKKKRVFTHRLTIVPNEGISTDWGKIRFILENEEHKGLKQIISKPIRKIKNFIESVPYRSYSIILDIFSFCSVFIFTAEKFSNQLESQIKSTNPKYVICKTGKIIEELMKSEVVNLRILAGDGTNVNMEDFAIDEWIDI